MEKNIYVMDVYNILEYIREFYNCGYLYVRIPSTEPIENKIEKLIPPNILVFKFSTTNLRSFRYLCRL
jgi:hypothetical protein